jgi:hypothetical protein
MPNYRGAFQTIWRADASNPAADRTTIIVRRANLTDVETASRILP